MAVAMVLFISLWAFSEQCGAVPAAAAATLNLLATSNLNRPPDLPVSASSLVLS